MEVLIQFDLPKSPAGRRALKLCRQLASFSEGDDGCQIALSPATMHESARLIPYMLKIIQGRSGTILSVNGALHDRHAMKAIIATTHCLLCSGVYDNQREYCAQFGVGIPSWGCRQLCSIARYSELQYGAERYWYQVGPFVDDVQWIDKHGLASRLASEAESKCLSLCPHFNWTRVEKVIASLPEMIDPSLDGTWTFRHSLDPASPGIIGVCPAVIHRYEVSED